MPGLPSDSNPPQKAAVSLRQVAELVGVSRMTVSRAFQKDAPISEELRKKVLEAAHKLGYKPDRMVSELMTSFASRRSISYQETFAAIWSPERWAEIGTGEGYHYDLYHGLIEGAKLHGRSIDHIVMTQEMTPRVIDRMLTARNIQGVILTPPSAADAEPPELKWDHLSAATIGYSYQKPNFHRTQPGHYNMMVRVLETLNERQYERPCLLIHSDMDKRTNRGYRAAFLAWGHDPARIWQSQSHCIPELSEWLNRVKPDVIIGDWELWHDLLPNEDQKTDFVALSVRSIESRVAGIYQDAASIAKCSVDLLVRARLQHERGEPREPLLMLTSGTWVEGTTLKSTREKKSESTQSTV
ncbi:LacI family DNA-binding transcriptional regulator [Puniceicoccus vermicola]|uniref:LacI family DNA-binding transcriptional regulator n=1 Tax=Puniceicoccus vermicola TaxID=388746 RepID=A0A7X1E624_9BACT|nr:LacI family DNA-binding transcriptional regulator [Puniceicoccus vermicola]MBC2602212.1 LacI family DNA-binding transcriptional regulator [Puniceicoccus vermicola]